MTYEAKILPLVIEPDPRLHTVSEPVKVIDDSIRRELDDMLVTMYHNNGVGLAAVQAGIMKRMCVVDVDQVIRGSGALEQQGRFEHGGKPLYMINPEIIKKSEEQFHYKEGCLSVPGVSADVPRFKEITIKFLDYEGKEQEITTKHELLCACIQHEINHMDGVIIMDFLSKLKQQFAAKKLKKYQKKK